MKLLRLIAALALLVLPALPAQAQLPLLGAGPGAAPIVAPSYTGPGDVVSGAKAYFGLRAYNASYAASLGNVGIFRRSSDSTTCTGVVNAAGNLDLTTTYCSGSTDLVDFCNNSAGNCFASTLYDQSGASACTSGVAVACNIVQATAADQPQLVFNCIGSLPCLQWTGGAGHKMLATYAFSSGTSQPWTVSIVMERTGNFTTYMDVVGVSASTMDVGWSGTSGNMYFYAGTNQNVAASNSAMHAIQAVGNGASSVVNVDGTESTPSPGTGAIAAGDITFGLASNSAPTGYVTEFAIYFSGFSGTQRTNMCHNQYTYWGTVTSC